jgi:hypothetical protein
MNVSEKIRQTIIIDSIVSLAIYKLKAKEPVVGEFSL